jgi:GR25 family glycosyltransferase involved in LPS biosynthesis
MFLQNCDVYYINLSNDTARNSYMTEQFKRNHIKDFFRVEAISYKNITDSDVNTKIVDKKPLSLIYSHAKAIRQFLEKSKKDYAIILEDDADISNISKIQLSVGELFEKNPEYECIQLAISQRIEDSPNFEIHERTFWDFSTVAYAIKKSYAKDFVEKFFKKDKLYLLDIEETVIFDPRLQKKITVPTTAEAIVYDNFNSLSWPVFTFTYFESTWNPNYLESDRQAKKSMLYHKRHWSKFDTIDKSFLNILGPK